MPRHPRSTKPSGPCHNGGVGSPSPYRANPSGAVPRCPLCDTDLAPPRPSTCATCGLWWVLPNERYERLRPPAELAGTGPVLFLRLRPPVVAAGFVPCLAFCLGCYGAALILVFDLAHGPGPARCLTSLGGLLLALWIGTFCAGCLVQGLLLLAVPSRLGGDESALRVRVWNTWEGLASAFRRTDVRVPREHLTGVLLGTAQNGDSQLFLLHASGLAFGTGWRGTRERALTLGEAVDRWRVAPPRD